MLFCSSLRCCSLRRCWLAWSVEANKDGSGSLSKLSFHLWLTENYSSIVFVFRLAAWTRVRLLYRQIKEAWRFFCILVFWFPSRHQTANICTSEFGSLQHFIYFERNFHGFWNRLLFLLQLLRTKTKNIFFTYFCYLEIVSYYFHFILSKPKWVFFYRLVNCGPRRSCKMSLIP